MSTPLTFSRADEHRLAWTLANEASPRMTKLARTWLWVQIGAGDYAAAIAQALSWQPTDCCDELQRHHLARADRNAHTGG